VRLFQFGPDVAHPITKYGSSFRLAPLLLSRAGDVRVHCAYLRPNDFIARHPATVPQLFCVVDGAGWVEGGDGERLPIVAGQAAFWTAGEEHAAGTDVGLTAIIIEADALDPATLLVEA
jgi:hypothetical protein